MKNLLKLMSLRKEIENPANVASTHKRKSFVVTIVLTSVAILVGVCLYSQVGFLAMPKSIANQKEVQHEHGKDTVALYNNPSNKKLEIKEPNSVSTEINDDKNTQQNSDNNQLFNKNVMPSLPAKSVLCDKSAKLEAEQTYKNSIQIENDMHAKNISSIGAVSKVMALTKMFKDKVTAENNRHQIATEAIESSYHKSLRNFECEI